MDGNKVECVETPPTAPTRLGVRGETKSSPIGKRKVDLPETVTRRERQAKYTKKTRNVGVFKRFVWNSVGLESLTSGVMNKPLWLFDEKGFVETCKLLESEYNREKEERLEAIYKRHTFDAIGKIGFGVASPVLMANLLQDLRGRTPNGLRECRFRNLKPEVGKGRADKASYAFFHWDKTETMSSGVISDYRKREYFLSKRTVKEIDGLGFGICRALFPGKFDTMPDDVMKEHILLLPAVVITKKAHDQALHLDGERGGDLVPPAFPTVSRGDVAPGVGKSQQG